MQWMKWMGASLVLCAVLAFGCNKAGNGGGDTSGDTTAATGGDEDHSDHDHGDHDHGDHDHDHGDAGGGDKISANLAKLSPEDRALAEKQKVCPVSDEPLGAMGVPIKVNVDGKDVFVCCESCKDGLKKKAEKKEEKKEEKK